MRPSRLLDANPADKLTRRMAGGVEATRKRVLTDDEIAGLLTWENPNAALLRFLLATGLRIQEAQRARVEHIVGDRLIVPKEHSKSAREHWVYLTPIARAQIEPQAATLLFRSVSPTGVQAAVKRWQGIDNGDRWTPHDLRRTFATRLGDLGVARHVVEKMLNHTAAGLAAIYNRAELVHERIAAACKWAGEMLEIFPGFVEPPGRLYRRAQAERPRG